MPDLTTGDLQTEGGASPVAVATTTDGKKLPTDGIIIVEPYASWTADGTKTILIKSRPFKISGKAHLLITRNKALGIITLSAPKKIDLKEFKRLEPYHKISSTMRKKFWPDRKTFWAYKIVKMKVFAAPIPIEPIKGPQVVAHDIKLKIEKSPSVFELCKADAKEFLDFGAWIGVLSSKAKSWANSVLQFVQGPPEAIREIKAVPGKLAGFARSLPKGGEADKDASLPVALENAMKFGKKAIGAIRRVGGVNYAEALKDAVEYLEDFAAIIDALDLIEDDGILRVKKEKADAESITS